MGIVANSIPGRAFWFISNFNRLSQILDPDGAKLLINPLNLLIHAENWPKVFMGVVNGH